MFKINIHNRASKKTTGCGGAEGRIVLRIREVTDLNPDP
jgi:hypothetical protein